MRQRDRFLAKLYARAGGRIDRTMHCRLHIALPLGLSVAETERCVHDLIALGWIEADPGFDRLIRLTPLGVAAEEELALHRTPPDAPEERIRTWRGFAVPSEMYGQLAEAAVSAGHAELPACNGACGSRSA